MTLYEKGFSYHLDEKNLVFTEDDVRIKLVTAKERIKDDIESKLWESEELKKEYMFMKFVENVVDKIFKEEFGKELLKIGEKMKEEKPKIKRDKKCIFWKDGKCNSDYARGLRCGGYAIIPKDCPYNKGDETH